MCKGISRREPGFRVQNWGSVLTLWRRSAKSGHGITFRLRLATMRRIGEIRQANFLERRPGPRRGRLGTQGWHFYGYAVYDQKLFFEYAGTQQLAYNPVESMHLVVTVEHQRRETSICLTACGRICINAPDETENAILIAEICSA